MTIRKILIANRGEIAVRVAKTARQLGITTVAVYSDVDADALHVTVADQAVRIGPAPAAESYLRAEAIIMAARSTGADAIHPGYGFLSENPEFVEAVEAAGLTFIGPSASAIRAMGLKDRAKALMERAGVPVVPGYHGDEQDAAFMRAQAREIGYPVLIKARAGGGGKGMRRVERETEFDEALASAQREAKNSFGDDRCLIEKYIERPRHIEVQVFGDRHGNVVHMFERDCSLQRRHQKVIEEAPAPGMTQEMRKAMGEAAVAAAKAVDYAGAGTVEFIVDGSEGLRADGFWFMEMNTRLQVEHPVTEAITGLDLVALQIAVADGKPLPFGQNDLKIDGHAIEARLYTEDAQAGFLPSTGTLKRLAFPTPLPTLRIDTGVREGDTITPFYDPMIAKIVVHGVNREHALRLLSNALEETTVAGSVTNRAFLAKLCRDLDFSSGHVDTGLIERKQSQLLRAHEPHAEDFALAALAVLRAPDGLEAHGLLENFRLFGTARQTVLLAGEEPLSVTVERNRKGACRVETPLGTIEFEAVRRKASRLEYRFGGISRQATVWSDDETILVQREATAQEFRRYRPGASDDIASGDVILAPMPGLVRLIEAEAGVRVAKGQKLAVLEAMKMEHALLAPRDGVVAEVSASAGDQVEQGAILITLEAEA